MAATSYVESSNDTLIGAIDGVNKAFILTKAIPYPASVKAFINPQIVGCTVAGMTVLFSQAPAIGDTASVAYSGYSTASFATTLLAILNRALLRIGQSTPIASYTENSVNAIKLRAVYYPCLYEVLSRNGVDWNFAKTRLPLINANIVSSSWIESSADTLVGAIDRVNTVFTVTKGDPGGVAEAYINPQIVGCTVAGRSITLSQAPAIGDTVTIACSPLIQAVGSGPIYGYKNAYSLPPDFIHLVSRKDHNRHYGGLVWDDNLGTYRRGVNYDPPVYPSGYPYVLEMFNGALCLLTDYDNSSRDLCINYIRCESDPSIFPPLFASAVAYRVGMDVAMGITESASKVSMMDQFYEDAYDKAVASNNSNDYIAHEAGNNSWLRAGR